MCTGHLKPLNKNNLNEKALRAAKNKQRKHLLQHIYNSKRWKQLRNDYISQHERCEICGSIATTVHHIKRFGSGHNKREIEKLAYDKTNLMALCTKCHLSKHHREIEKDTDKD